MMQRLTASIASLALATHGLTLGGAIADHGNPAETEQPTLSQCAEGECDCTTPAAVSDPEPETGEFVCADTSKGALDPYGTGCEFYTADPSYCSYEENISKSFNP